MKVHAIDRNICWNPVELAIGRQRVSTKTSCFSTNRTLFLLCIKILKASSDLENHLTRSNRISLTVKIGHIITPQRTSSSI